jgi:hypothetical protein
VLQNALVIFLNVTGHLNGVNGGATPFLFDVSAKSQCLSPAARVLTLVGAILEFRLLGMVTAMEELAPDEIRLAHSALKGDQARPNLPVDVFPLDVLLIIHKLDESIKVEEPIGDMLCDDLSMEVDEYLSIGTHHPLVLFTRVELTTINTPAQKG